MTSSEYSITHDGRHFRGYGTSLQKVRSFRCDRYLPAGTSPATPDIIWTGRDSAKKQNPGFVPYRCPGVLVVDKKTGYRSFSTACECTPSSIASPIGVTLLADAAAASVGQLMNDSASNSHEGAAVEDNDDDYHPKMSKFENLNHEGRIYRATSTSDGITRFRCLRYLPAGTTPSADSIWKCRTSVKKENPSGNPYRCPGILMVNKETGRTLFHAAHECTLSRWGIPSKKSATAGSSVSPSLGNNGGESSRNADGGVELRIPRKAIIFHEDDTSLSNEDDSSIASDKDYYKNLCRRLTASLVAKKGVKRENKQVKRENKRLKRENSELNGRLRDISNLCAGCKGNN